MTMMVDIDYYYAADGWQDCAATVRVSFSDAVAAAVEALGGVNLGDRVSWVGGDDGECYSVSIEDAAMLGAALLDGRTMGEVYSVWCSMVDDYDGGDNDNGE